MARLVTFVASGLTGRHIAADIALSFALIAWARHTNRNGGTR